MKRPLQWERNRNGESGSGSGTDRWWLLHPLRLSHCGGHGISLGGGGPLPLLNQKLFHWIVSQISHISVCSVNPPIELKQTMLNSHKLCQLTNSKTISHYALKDNPIEGDWIVFGTASPAALSSFGINWNCNATCNAIKCQTKLAKFNLRN